MTIETDTDLVRLRLSFLQRDILIILSDMNKHNNGPVTLSAVKKLVQSKSSNRVYMSNLRASCLRMKLLGMLDTLRIFETKFAVQLTAKGEIIATELLAEEKSCVLDSSNQMKPRPEKLSFSPPDWWIDELPDWYPKAKEHS